jgi:hypothetical protein
LYAVWSRFLPCDLPRFVDAAERSLIALPSYKARFMCLSDDAALLLGRVMVRTFRFGRSSPRQGSNLTKYSCVCSCSGCGWTKLQAPSATPSPRGRWIFRGVTLGCTGAGYMWTSCITSKPAKGHAYQTIDPRDVNMHAMHARSR